MGISNLIDWVLRLVGLFTFIICPFSLIFNLMKDKYCYCNINIISNPSYETLNKVTYYDEFTPEGHSSGDESTFLSPTDSCIYNIKLHELYLNKKGKLKKGKVIFKAKKLSPNNAILFNIFKTCGAPSYIVSWENNLGYISEYTFAENGFNGNTDLNIIEYRTTFINYVFNHIFYK